MDGAREFSHVLEIVRLPTGGRTFAIAADPVERAALARRLGLEALDLLRAEGRVARRSDGEVILVRGQLEAEVTQLCVVTLEPVRARLEVPIERIFVTADRPAVREIVIDPLATEPEPLPGDTLDLGELAAEELALALDPYPRAPAAAPAMPVTERLSERGKRPRASDRPSGRRPWSRR